MKVSIVSCTHPDRKTPAYLHLEPQCQRDLGVLEMLLRRYAVLGFGRDPETGDVIHVQVSLELKNE